jgi:hypothetical protein
MRSEYDALTSKIYKLGDRYQVPPSVEMLCFLQYLFINEFRSLSAISMFLSDYKVTKCGLTG